MSRISTSSLSYLLFNLFNLISTALAVAPTDSTPLGSYFTPLPLYRTGAGTNVVEVGVGTPPQNMNLTLSTNVDYVLITTIDCGSCTQAQTEYSASESKSLTQTQQALQYAITYPEAPQDTLTFSAIFASEILVDTRSDFNVARPIALVNAIESGAVAAGGLGHGLPATLSAGTAGFWGLGIDNSNARRSIIPSLLATSSSGSPSSASSYIVGFDIYNTTARLDTQAGIVHWGGVPIDAYVGDFHWMDANTSVAGGWGINVDRMRIGSTVIDTSALYGSLDPAFDAIYVPTNIAESIFVAVPSARRDLIDTTRWNLPCNTDITMSITIGSVEYNVDSKQLVQPRDLAGQTCWSSIIAWSNGSIPEQRGEIRLGTPFMSGIYSAIYYSGSQQLVGIVGKAGSVNDFNAALPSGGVNGRLAGGLIGGLLGALFLGFVLCYARNRNNFQSIWFRAIRRQQRAQMNAVIRGTTVPPVMPVPMGIPGPMMGMPPMVPVGGYPMMGPQYGAGYNPGIGYGYQPPPRYQPPMEQPQQPQYPQRHLDPPQQYALSPQQQPLLGTPQSYHPSPSVPIAVPPLRSGSYIQRSPPPSRPSGRQPRTPLSSRGRFPGFFRSSRAQLDTESQMGQHPSAGSRVRFGGSGDIPQVDPQFTASHSEAYAQNYGSVPQHAHSAPNPTAMYHTQDPPPSAGSEKKRYQIWRSGRGQYEPVLPGLQTESPRSMSRDSKNGDEYSRKTMGRKGRDGKIAEIERERRVFMGDHAVGEW